MKKGFTLAEMLAVILILGMIMLIGVPIYQNVQKDTNESIYESKISNVKSKAEVYSEEHGIFIFDIRQMMEWGLITPDNESGEYRNPVNGKDMKCYLVMIELENNQYYAKVIENDRCYSSDEINNMNSVVRIVFYTKDEYGEFKVCNDGWIKANEVYAGYEIPDGATNVSASWNGEAPTESDGKTRIDISSGVVYRPIILDIKFDYNGQTINQTVSRQIMIDNEAPTANLREGNNEPSANSVLKEWVLSDGEGSGVTLYAITKANDYDSCNEVPILKYSAVRGEVVSEYLDNGSYRVCVRDKVGNIGARDTVVNNVYHSAGTISNFSVVSEDDPYQLKNVKLLIDLNVSENDRDKCKMCISHSGYRKDCSWEDFKAVVNNYNLKDFQYGATVPFYVSVVDQVGNISDYREAVEYKIDGLVDFNIKEILNGNADYLEVDELGKFDLYENGNKIQSAVSSYSNKMVPGTKYVIKNITSNSGYRYKGASEIEGTIPRGEVTNVEGYSTTVNLNYVKLYTISYNMNGGSGSVASQTKEHGTNINLQTTNSTKAGYTFGGWNTKSDGTGTNYNAGGAYSGNGNVTLYAKWNPKIITIPLNNQSASSAGTTNVYYKYNINAYYSNSGATTGMSSITKPSKTGHTFKGYYTGTNGGGTQYINANGGFVNNLYKAFTTNTTLYAYWTVNSYTVTWNANGGSCNKTSSAYNYNTAIGTLPTCSRNGYAFQGWFTAASGGSKIATTTKVTGNVTYFAQWKSTGLDVNNYNESKATLCDANKFRALITNDINRFKSGLDSQNFRNALYDCASVTEPILRSSDAAYAAIRANSRTRVVSGKTKGSSKKSCYLEKDYSDNVCTENDDYFATGNLYGAKVFVLGASTTTAVNNAYVDTSASGGGCNCDDTGWGECENSTSSKDCEFNAYIIILDGNGSYKGSCSWGACNTSSNALVNPSSGFTCRDSGLRVGKFQNGVKGVLQGNGYQWYERSSQDRNNIKYVAGDVFIQIFPI